MSGTHEKVSSCPRGMPEFRVRPIRAQIEFSRLPFPSSTVFMPAELRALRRRLTCAACTLTLAHQAMSSFSYSTLAEIAQEIRSRNISPVEIIELHLNRIEALRPKLNAFVHLDADGTRRQARAMESSILRGAPLGPLHSVPPSIKSCIDVSGWP